MVSVPDEQLQDALAGVPDLDCVVWDLQGTPPRDAFDIVVAPYLHGNEPLRNLEGVSVRLVQWQSIGFDGVPEVLPEGIALANASTVHETATAEIAVGLAIAGQRGFGDAVRNQMQGVWDNQTQPGLADQRVLLLGYGGVSKAIDARLAPFEVEVTRVASRARGELHPAGNTVHVHGVAELERLLPNTDIVIVGLPLTDSTHHLLNEHTLSLLPDGALLVNVGRGPIVDTDALVSELASGRLRAALDVVDPEPLPADHPLWKCENLFITPHNGGDTHALHPRMVRLIRRQIERMRDGEKPENIVIPGEAYR